MEKLKCKKCGSGQIYTKKTTNERICKKCGNVEKIIK